MQLNILYMPRFISLLVIGLMTIGTYARQLTPDQALARISPSLSRATANYQLSFTASDDSYNLLYVFSTPEGGFSILSADDCMPPLIGYSDTDTFDSENMPDNMRYWIDSYADQIRYAITNGLDQPQSRAESRKAIAPLVTTYWNQTSPYNNLCPLVGSIKTPTGCVASALAQVMNYHKWPEKGTGSITYQWNNTSLSMDFASTAFDWANMAPTYSGNSTSAQIAAVSILMKACGYGVQMNYGADASGALTPRLQEALINYFGYDKGVTYIERNYYSGQEWEEILYNELSASRPVIYGGDSDSGGHCFVCDGYRDGYYHINWGWGGMSNGYFLITLLNPTLQGVGGSTSGYQYNQDMTIGIRKPVNGSKTTPFMVTADQPNENHQVTTGEFTVDKTDLSKSGTAYFGNNFSNMSFIPAEVNFGLKLVDQHGNTTYVKCAYTDEEMSKIQLKMSGSYLRSFPVKCSALPSSGTYTITPIYYVIGDGNWKNIHIPENRVSSMTMTCTPSSVKFTPIAAITPRLTVKNFTLDTKFYLNAKIKVTATLSTADAEYYGPIQLALFEPGTSKRLASALGKTMVDILPGQSQEVTIIDTFTSGTAQKTYDLCLIDQSGNRISEPISVTPIKLPAITLVRSTALEFENATSAGAGQPVTVSSEGFSIKATVNCASGYFAGNGILYLMEPTDNNMLSTVIGFATPFITLSEGESTTMTVSGSFPEAQPGKTYYACLNINNKFTSGGPQIPVKFSGTSGISEIISEPSGISVSGNIVTVTADSNISRVDLFSIGGRHLASYPSSASVVEFTLSQGIYVVRAVTADGTIVKKIAIK